MNLMLVDGHCIYRRGLAASLEAVVEVTGVIEAATADEAEAHPALDEVDVAIVDLDVPRSCELVRRLATQERTRALVCSRQRDQEQILAAVEAGALGFLAKDSLTPEGLAAGVRGAAAGNGVMAPELLGGVLHGIARASRDVLQPRGLTLSRLTPREREVLRLVAEGLSTREVAAQMSYSERTVKNVLHDAVVKMNARTRSEAVAQAVRERLI